MIYVGQLLPGMGMSYGFGRDCYDEMRVEAFGADWVVARDGWGKPQFALVTPDEIDRINALTTVHTCQEDGAP